MTSANFIEEKFTKVYVRNLTSDLRTSTIYAAPNSESDLDPETRIVLGKRMFIKRVRKKYFLTLFPMGGQYDPPLCFFNISGKQSTL